MSRRPHFPPMASWFLTTVLGCAATPSAFAQGEPDAARHAEAATQETALDHDPQTGFFALAVREAPYIKAGVILSADDVGSLRRLWHEYELPGPIPPADFSTYRVILFTVVDACRSELSRLFLSNGQLQPEFVQELSETCGSSWVRYLPVTLYAVAVRRDRLPMGSSLTLGPVRIRPRPALTNRHVPDGCSAERPVAPLPQKGNTSTLKLPRPGEVRLQYLRDGSPVFVVRHQDSTLDVFAADLPSQLDLVSDPQVPLRGLRTLVRWDCSRRRFFSSASTHDEYGISTNSAVWSSLQRYQIELVQDGQALILHQLKAGYGPRRVSPTGASVQNPHPQLSVSTASAVSISEARALPLGSWVIVDADLVADAVKRPRLCAPTPSSCATVSAPAKGVTWQAHSRLHMRGPFAVRVERDGFSSVTYTGLQEPSLSNIRSRPWPTPRLHASLSAAGAWDSGLWLGAEAELGVWGTLSPRGDLMRVLLGVDWGIAWRTRWVASADRDDSTWLLGLAPTLSHADVYRDWSYPSPLGVLLPEFGVGYSGSQAFPFVAWSLPVEYRFESPRTRRHPLEARDVLGIRVSPAMLLAIEPQRTNLIFALSAGMTAW